MTNSVINANPTQPQSPLSAVFRQEVEATVAFLLDRKSSILQSLGGEARIYFATGNYGKVREFKGFMSRMDHLAELLDGILTFDVMQQVADVDETEPTFHGNSALKSLHNAAALAAGPTRHSDYVMAEDSGLVVPSLNGGEPGVISARYFETHFRSYPEETFAEALRFRDEVILSNEKDPLPVREKDASDFLNKVMLVHRLREDWFEELDIRVPANFCTVTTISSVADDAVVAYGFGAMPGQVVVPAGFSLADRENLRALHNDFGYNSVFHVDRPNGDTVILSDVPVEERMRWNHRSASITRAILQLLLRAASPLRGMEVPEASTKTPMEAL